MAEWAEIDFDRVETHTEDAVLFIIDERIQWVPRSLINGDAPVPGDQARSVEVRAWWAAERGLI